MAKTPKLSPWFHPEVKPVRRGWYQTKQDGLHVDATRFWNGKWWSWANVKAIKSATQDWSWRGLAEQPK